MTNLRIINPTEEVIMSKIELNQALINATIAALNAEGVVEDLTKADEVQQGADRKWARIAAKFYKAGIRSTMIVGRARVRETVAATHRVIIESWPKRHQELLALRGPAVTDLSDAEDGLRSKRQANIGTYTSLIARHLRNLEDPQTRGASDSAAKTDAPTETSDPIVILQGFLAQKTKLVDIAAVDRFENSMLECIALIRAHRKA